MNNSQKSSTVITTKSIHNGDGLNKYAPNCTGSYYAAAVTAEAVAVAETPSRCTNSVYSKSQWNSSRTDISVSVHKTPITEGKYRTNFSFRLAVVPEGYPKAEAERDPRRESMVSEFTRRMTEGYDIWDDEDRPLINWKYPKLPIRVNRTHELRKEANILRINKMMEREKQMNKRNLRVSTTSSMDKKEKAWWEKGGRNGVKQQYSFAMPTNSVRSNGGWCSNVSMKSNFVNRGYSMTPRR